MLNRKNPLIITISTASDYLEGIGYEQYQYACNVRDKVFVDDTFLPVIYGAPEDAEWTSPKTWASANPSIGHTVTEDDLKQLYTEAQNEPRKEAEFRMFHLNQWLSAKHRTWINPKLWRDCGKKFNPDSLLRMDCVCGIDLARRYDLAAYVLLFHFDDCFYLLPRFFMPRDLAKKKEAMDHVPYLNWAKHGWITLTDGDVIDFAYIRHAVSSTARVP